MNHVECVIKRDVSREKCIMVQKISVVYHSFVPKNIRGILKNIYDKCYCIGFPLFER